MAQQQDVSIRFGADWVGQKGIAEAQKGVAGFAKSVKLLAGSYAAVKITQFAKESLAAFREDQKAALALTNTMKNLNMAMTGVAAEGWIQRLSLASGIVSEKLSPAFQDLIRVTGDYEKSQKLLGTAIDVSRSSSVDLETVAYDLSQAYVGNTKGLKKYSLGLTNAQLAAMSFDEIITKLNSSFAGSNAKYLESYAGKMDQLTTGADKAKEIIGQGLMQALDNLAGGSSGSGITALVNLMVKLSEWTAKFIAGIGSLAGSISLLFQGKFKDAYTMFQQGTSSPSYKGATPSISALVMADEKRKAATLALQNARAVTAEEKKQLAIARAKAAEAKKKAALDQASAILNKAQQIFDMERIQLAAAMQGKLSEEDKVRLKLKEDILNLEEAIQNNNVQAAASYANAIVQDSQKLQALRGDMESLNFINNPFNAWLETIRQMAAELAKIANMPIVQSNSYAARGGTGMADFGGAAYQLPVNPYAGTYYGETGRDPMPVQVYLNVDGKTVADALVNTSNSGTSSSSARGTGQFS
jgi:hypothetical protein